MQRNADSKSESVQRVCRECVYRVFRGCVEGPTYHIGSLDWLPKSKVLTDELQEEASMMVVMVMMVMMVMSVIEGEEMNRSGEKG